MILIEISKQTLLERRQENLWQCQTDQFGTTYCPTGLESAKSYTAYSPSTSLEREDTVIDYEQGTYAEKTSVVRDFMDGFATAKTSSVVDYQSGSGTSNVGTVIDYQNGSSVKRTGSVVDYTKKITEEVCSSAEMFSYCADSSMSYSNASSYCSNLVEGGYSDWRLPSIYETGIATAMGAGVGVPSCLTGWTWTSSEYGYDWYVWHGQSVNYLTSSQMGYVVCVR